MKWYGRGGKDKGGFQLPIGVFAKYSDWEPLWILIKKNIDEFFTRKLVLIINSIEIQI